MTDEAEAASSQEGLDSRYAALLKASSEVLYRMSPDWTEMRQLGGGGFLPDSRVGNRNWLSDYIPEEDQPAVRAAIAEAIGSKDSFELEHRVRRIDGSAGWTLSRAVPVMGPDGEVSEWFGAASDITARKEAELALRTALAERESLLKEVHHRVKNNLQVITSLLEMQERQIADQVALSVFGEARNRVAAIAAIHDYLYRSNSLSSIDLTVYSRELVQHLIWFYRAQDRIEAFVDGSGMVLDLEQGVPFGLLLNELVSNVCKHAFPDGSNGKLVVRLTEARGDICLEVMDSGTGLPPDFETRARASLGVSLVHTLVEQLKGTVSFHSDGGTEVVICLPRLSL